MFLLPSSSLVKTARHIRISCAASSTKATSSAIRAFASLNCITVVPGAVGAWRKDLLVEAGGFPSDTLAEDQDLTLRIRRLGYRSVTKKQRSRGQKPHTIFARWRSSDSVGRTGHCSACGNIATRCFDLASVRWGLLRCRMYGFFRSCLL